MSLKIIKCKGNFGNYKQPSYNVAKYVQRPVYAKQKIRENIPYILIQISYLTQLDPEGVDSTTFSEYTKFRLILLNKHVPRLSDF